MPRTLHDSQQITVEPQIEELPAVAAKPQRPWAVILHNDDNNGFVFVINSLRKVLHCGYARAFRLTFEAHLRGRAMVWTGFREHAELKAEQIHACGADPNMIYRGAQPLTATVEPIPE